MVRKAVACLDVVECGVDAEGQVARQSPGRSGPSHHLCVVRVIIQGEGHLQVQKIGSRVIIGEETGSQAEALKSSASKEGIQSHHCTPQYGDVYTVAVCLDSMRLLFGMKVCHLEIL